MVASNLIGIFGSLVHGGHIERHVQKHWCRAETFELCLQDRRKI